MFLKKLTGFKKAMPTLWLGIAISMCLWLGWGQNSAIAMPITATEPIALERAQPPAEQFVKVEPEVERFLKSIPAGYFTVASAEELKGLLENPETVLVDVRESSEYRAGHIPKAINIPLRSLTQNLDLIPRDRPVVLSCSTGYRSAIGVTTLHLLGYDNVKGFPPSFAGWKAAGEAIARS